MSDSNQKLHMYVDRPLPDLMAELALYDDTMRGGSETWQRMAGPIRRRICEEWNGAKSGRMPALRINMIWL